MITVRLAGSGDLCGLADLAELSGHERPRGEVLVAEVDGRLWAALPLGGDALADPFRPTADAVALLRLRASQLDAGERLRDAGRRRLRALRLAPG